MRSIVFFLSISLSGSLCMAQIDTSKVAAPREQSATTRVPIPGVDTPMSGPGTMLQSPADPNAGVVPQRDRKNRKAKTVPPSDPRAFGVGVPIGKAKKDSLR